VEGLLIIVTYYGSIFDKLLIAGTRIYSGAGIIEQVGNVRVLYSSGLSLTSRATDHDLLLLPPHPLVIPPENSVSKAVERRYLKSDSPARTMSVAEKKCAALWRLLLLWMTDFITRSVPRGRSRQWVCWHWARRRRSRRR